MNAITHIVIQAGYCMFGAGHHRQSAIEDAAKWMDGGLTPDEVAGQIKARPNDGEMAVLDEHHPEFGAYLKNQGGYEFRDGQWFEA